MRTHPYLRAYMAGIVVPTLFLLIVVAVDAYQKVPLRSLQPVRDSSVFKSSSTCNLVSDGRRSERMGSLEHVATCGCNLACAFR